ncbi:hypothetical protein LTR36_002864 [Oleoguttula mirabilis]|uniref:Uncharacterized protein n=1 Tax=Oleoguttula mirabilis TaxID=1507867 RepID=A0AAV9JJT8_9PEZI|nr:hypothetical protein LTR36_002864 [Oleoguttula mirabilis]
MLDFASLCDKAQADGKFLPLGDLANDIHPLFARENFLGDIDYETLIPCLRLLTRILDTPQIRHYLYVTWFGRNERVGLWDTYDRVLEAYNSDRAKITSLSDDDIKAVQQKLNCLAKMVKFRVSGVEERRKQGWCTSTVRPAVPGVSRPSGAPPGHPNDLPGLSSTIFLAQFWYDAINQVPSSDSDSDSAPATLGLDRFSVTMVLLHEFGHAAHFAAIGSRHEDFFADSALAEAGFEIHARLLGACYEAQPGVIRASKLHQWPNKAVAERYEYKLPCRTLESPAVPEQHWRWFLPERFALAMQHEWFWQWAAEAGPTAFVPPGVAQVVRVWQRTKVRPPVSPTIAELFAVDGGASGAETRVAMPRRARQTVTMRERRERAEAWAVVAAGIGSLTLKGSVDAPALDQTQDRTGRDHAGKDQAEKGQTEKDPTKNDQMKTAQQTITAVEQAEQ